ncbi:MAG TPA: EAL domain-containing protein [Geomonas sp.]|nr:EAL domain-containing protein [Geomonas sp.]
MFRKTTTSVRGKILLIMMISGLPIFTAFIIFIANQYHQSIEQSRRDLLSSVKSTALEHRSQVEGIRNLLNALSEIPEIRAKDPAGCSRILNTLLEKSPSSINVGIADVDGRVLATGLKQPLPIKYVVGDRKYFQDAVRSKQFSAGEYTISRAVRRTPTLHFALPVTGPDGKVNLVLYAAYNLDSFARIFDAQGLPRGSIINLTDHKGTVLYRHADIPLAPLDGMPDDPRLRSHLTGPSEEGVFTAVGLDGVKRLIGFKRVRLGVADAPYLFIRISIPEASVLANARASVVISVMVFALAAFITYLLSQIISSLHISRPIEQLVAATKLVKNGHLSIRSELPHSADEIGELASSFDEMTSALGERIRELSEAEGKLHQLAYYDPLTTLANRRLLHDRLNLAVGRSLRQGASFALLYLDIDNFKNINDSLGHTAGDQLLQVLAKRYQQVIRSEDFICRLGGDEFALLALDIHRDEDVSVVVSKLLESTRAPILLDGKELAVSTSIGVALFPRDAKDTSTLEKYADIALYHAKAEGKNTFRIFSEELNRSSHERIGLTHALQHALEREELQLHYQPVICNANGRVCKVEALLRWRCEEFGVVMPEKFIPIAEESGTIAPIGEWVLRTACEQQVAWKKAGYDLSVAVNISAAQLKTPQLIQRLKEIIEECGIVPAQLEIELTESYLAGKPELVRDCLQKLRETGCKIAIDDFGTGYSSLSYLKNLPVNVLKIDRSFVRDVSSDPSDLAIAHSIVALANNLHLETVAEGVETEAQQAILHGIGCQYSQGYLHSPPVPAGEIPALLRQAGGKPLS